MLEFLYSVPLSGLAGRDLRRQLEEFLGATIAAWYLESNQHSGATSIGEFTRTPILEQLKGTV